MKGHEYPQKYQEALKYLGKVKAFLDLNPEYKLLPRIKLAKKIEKGCQIDFNTARFIITKLYRDKYLVKANKQSTNGNVIKLDNFFKIN